ncbi:MAG: hypothetical protein WB445_01605 [Acinetobacter sp.]
MTEVFKAGVQYDDYKGSVAADDADTSTLKSALRKEFNLKDSEVIIGISAYASYFGRTTDIENINIKIYVSQDENLNHKLQNNEKIKAKKFEKDLSINSFFKLFKRFELTLSSKGELEEANIEIVN